MRAAGPLLRWSSARRRSFPADGREGRIVAVGYRRKGTRSEVEAVRVASDVTVLLEWLAEWLPADQVWPAVAAALLFDGQGPPGVWLVVSAVESDPPPDLIPAEPALCWSRGPAWLLPGGTIQGVVPGLVMTHRSGPTPVSSDRGVDFLTVFRVPGSGRMIRAIFPVTVVVFFPMPSVGVSRLFILYGRARTWATFRKTAQIPSAGWQNLVQYLVDSLPVTAD